MAKYSRHTRFNKALAQAVCERLSNGESLNKICSDVKMPSRKSIYNWLKADDVFLKQYVLARALQAEMFAEQIIDLADDVDASSVAQFNKVKLQIDARKWYAAKVALRKFEQEMFFSYEHETSDHARLNLAPLSPAQAYHQMLAGHDIVEDVDFVERKADLLEQQEDSD